MDERVYESEPDAEEQAPDECREALTPAARAKAAQDAIGRILQENRCKLEVELRSRRIEGGSLIVDSGIVVRPQA